MVTVAINRIDTCCRLAQCLCYAVIASTLSRPIGIVEAIGRDELPNDDRIQSHRAESLFGDVFAGLGFCLCAIQRYLFQAHQPCFLAEPQYLRTAQSGQLGDAGGNHCVRLS